MCNPKLTPPPVSFAPHWGHPADILTTAFCVAEFLANVSPAMAESNGFLGLTEHGSTGLGMILDALKNTINAALVASGSESMAKTWPQPEEEAKP